MSPLPRALSLFGIAIAVIFGLVLGLAYGVLAAQNGWGAFTTAWIKPFGTIFITALKLIAVPLVLVQLSQMSMSFVDVMMVGRLGTEALAAIVLVVYHGVHEQVQPFAARGHNRLETSASAVASSESMNCSQLRPARLPA